MCSTPKPKRKFKAKITNGYIGTLSSWLYGILNASVSDIAKKIVSTLLRSIA